VLRLLLEHGPAHMGETGKQRDSLSVRLLKRRGPPLAHSIALQVGSPALARLLAAATQNDAGHALDCTAAHA
jgi:hypothetical protein